jgi:zinc protease
VIRNPAFAPGEVERLRAQRLSTIANERTSPGAIAARALPPLLYGSDSPYGRPLSGNGDETTIASLDRGDIVSEHQTWIRPDNATVFVVSDLPLDAVTQELERAFGDWRAPQAPRGSKTFGAPVTPGQSRIVLINRPQSPQSLIYGGVVLPLSGTDDLLTLNTANTVLGTDFLSRINADLRETKGWSYGVRGMINPLERQTPYFISAPVQANRTGDSITALLEQYKAFLSDRGVTPEELERTVNGNTRSLAGGFETSAQLLNALRSNALFDRPDDYYETVASRTRALTTADLDAAARGAIRPDGIVWVVVGDAEVVRPQLDALGLPVEVREAD